MSINRTQGIMNSRWGFGIERNSINVLALFLITCVIISRLSKLSGP